jgi:hypothetical protein
VGAVDRGRVLISAAATLARISIDRLARQSLTAGPFSRELRAPYRKEVFRPRFWPLPIADATSAQSLQKDSKNVLRSRAVVARAGYPFRLQPDSNRQVKLLIHRADA